jgi:hypothetical protein
MGCFHGGSLALTTVKAAHFSFFTRAADPNPDGDISNERPMGTFLLVDDSDQQFWPPCGIAANFSGQFFPHPVGGRCLGSPPPAY